MWDTINTVKIPVTMKISTATSERCERRPRPHTPCPLVQPEPSTVPNPTRKPAGTSMSEERVSTCGTPSIQVKSAPPPTRPKRKAQRQNEVWRWLVNTPLVMLLIPLMRPTPASRIQLATPIRTPPFKDSE